MSLYSNKRKTKIVLLIIALVLVGASLFVSNRIVKKVAKREKDRVAQWANAVKKRAELVRLTNNSFNELRSKELSEMQLWIDATKEISRNTGLNTYQSYDLPLKIINRNKDIPVIVLDQNEKVSTYINLELKKKNLFQEFPQKDTQAIEQLFEDSLVQLAHTWENIHPSFTMEVYEGMYMSFYYNDSKKIIRLEKERDSLIHTFNKDLIENPELVPVILTDSSKTQVIATNLAKKEVDSSHLQQTLKRLAQANTPMKINISEEEVSYVFFASSPEIAYLQYFPYIQFLLIGLFIFIGYIIFSTFRKAEQNKVWAGMAKETAHQLGTPISSLMAWIQLLQEKEESKAIAKEMDKDVTRLSQVSERFSKIGTESELKEKDLVATLQKFFSYFATRIPGKVNLEVNLEENQLIIPHNPSLFDWVIENICKNAIDAMEGEGELKIHLFKQHDKVCIDISDDGKGMTASQQRNIFQPGFTTKKRGWGLGLSLAKRIVEVNHKGKLKIHSSELHKGTIFRIILSIKA